MRRIACLLLALALCCALSACKKPTPIAPTTAETTAMIEKPVTGENEIQWRILDLDDEENAGIKQWIKDRQENRYPELPAEYPMGSGKTVTRDYPVVLTENGKETVLLDRRYLGDSDNPEQDEIAWISPNVFDVINERYFVVSWSGWEYIAGISVYDTKEMREIPVKWDAAENASGFMYHAIFEDGLYLVDTEYGPYFGQLHLMRADLTQLPSETLQAIDMLAGIPHAPAEEVSDYELTQDGRRFIVADRNGLYLFDLQANALTYLPKTGFGVEMREDWEHAYFSSIALRDAHTLYLYGEIDNEHFKSYMAEITLP